MVFPVSERNPRRPLACRAHVLLGLRAVRRRVLLGRPRPPDKRGAVPAGRVEFRPSGRGLDRTRTHVHAARSGHPGRRGDYDGVLGHLLVRDLCVRLRGVRLDGVRDDVAAGLGAPRAGLAHVVSSQRPPDGRHRGRRVLHGHGGNGPPEHAHRSFLRGLADFPRVD